MASAKKSTKIVLVICGIALLLGAGITFAKWPRSDQELHAALLGLWRAEDPDNGALHHRKAAVQSEEVLFNTDGRVAYTVRMKSDASPPKGEPWGWEVVKGKLVLRDLGEGSTQERYAPVRFDVNKSTLTIRRKAFPPKVFLRVTS